MDLRVLGSIDVAGDKGSVALGGPQRRLLLALLLARPGKAVPTAALAEALWGDEPPPAATTVLHSQVSRLRKLLEPDRPARAPSMLRSLDDGYVLDVADLGHDLDSARFTRLAGEGRAAMRAGDPDGARRKLGDALALWRGPAFGELGTHPALFTAAVELDERRTTVLEWLVDLRLAAGEHAELVAELEPIVSDHPFRERFWGQLMLALYRCGRQAEALSVFQRCRRLLIDELGIEPGTELSALDEAILLQKPELDWDGEPGSVPSPAGTARAAGQSRPLPAPRSSFIGRDAELDDLHAAVEADRLVTITGPGGVGKTRLAVELSHRVADRFRHGVAFCDLIAVPSSDADAVAAAVARAVGTREPVGVPVQDQHRMLAGELVGRELLLVVDNADHTTEAVAELADSVLTLCPRVRVLVTSRTPLHAAGERIVRLAPLAADSAAAPAARLFVDRAALAAPDARLRDDEVVALCRRIDGLPLAIELAASRLATVPLDHLIAGLDDRLSSLVSSQAPTGATPHGTLRDVVGWSIDLLDDGDRVLLRRAAVFAGGFSAAAAAVVCETGGDPVDALGRLAIRSLVQLDHGEGEHRYRLLETIRADGLARLAEAGELDAVGARHLAWCLRLVSTSGEPSHGEDPVEIAALGREIDNVVAALSWGLAGGDVAGGARLTISAAPWWAQAGRLTEARAWLERAATSTPPGSAEHARSCRWLGWVLARQGELGAARNVLLDALGDGPGGDGDVGGDYGDDVGVDIQLLLAKVEVDRGELRSGEERLRAVAELPAVRDVPARRATVRHVLGRGALMAGELPKAEDQLESAVAEARAVGMWQTLVQALAALAQASGGRRRFERAEGAIADALATARRHALLSEMPSIFGAGAVLAYRMGDGARAYERFEEALAAARRVGDRHIELATLSNLGTCALHEGRAAESVELFEDALDLANRVSDDRTALLITTNLAEAVLAASHDTRRAMDLATDALARAREAGVRIAAVAAVETAAMALAARGEDGDLELAAYCIGAAAAERDALDRPHDAGDDTPVHRVLERIVAEVGADAADGALQRGRETGLDRAAEEMLAAVGAPVDAGHDGDVNAPQPR